MINRIRDVRRQKGLTLAEVAAACDPPTTAQTVGRLETGMRNLSLDWMNRIAAALGVEPQMLLKGNDTAAAQIVARAVFALRRLDRQAQQRGAGIELRRQYRVARGGQRFGPGLGQAGDDLRRRRVVALEQHLRLDPERGGDAVHPVERKVAHAGFEPADGLRRCRRVAGRGDFGQCQAFLPAYVADAVDHDATLYNRIGYFSFPT